MRLRTSLLIVVCLTAPSLGSTQDLVPQVGLAAEIAGRWDDALAVYRDALDRDPRRADLWVRVSDIEARLGNRAASVDALEHAVHASPEDSRLYARLSQAHASNGRPVDALAAIEGALRLEPGRDDYLETRATLATWAGDYDRARDSYRRLRRARPYDLEVVLGLARVSAWNGETDDAVDAYRRYLGEHPENAGVWLELARAESWRGNYGAALEALACYRERFGVSLDHARELADVVARAGRPTQALQVVAPLLERTPDDYQLNLTRTLALALQRKTRDTRDSLRTVQQLQPDRHETRSAERVVRAMLGSAVEAPGSVYSDSDGLQVLHVAPSVQVALDSGTRVDAGYERHDLRAGAGGGLEQIGGALTARHEQVWLGVTQQIGRVQLRGQVGRARVPARDLTPYGVVAAFAPADTVRFQLERRSDFFVVSPRTVGLGLSRVAHRIRLGWDLSLRDHLELDARHEDLSDGNQRWDVALSLRRSMARTQRLNLDLGLAARRFGAARDLDHGYYDPGRYESYSVVAIPYWKVSTSTGLGFFVAVGAQRDASTSSFRLGGDAAVEATIGINDPWVLTVSASGTLNRRLESGAFRGFGGNVALVRRF